MTSTLYVQSALGNERILEVEYDVDPGEKSVTSGPSDGWYPGSAPSINIEKVWLCHPRKNGKGYARRQISEAVITSKHEDDLLEAANEDFLRRQDDAVDSRIEALRERDSFQ